MKKLIAFLLCGMMTLAMTACGNSSSAEEPIGVGKEQIPNPFVECATLEEAAGLAGFTLSVPDTVEGYAYRQIFAIKNELLEVVYTNEDRSSEAEELSETEADYEFKDFCVRKGTGNEDISGDYNEYPETNTISAGDLQITTKGNDGKVNVAIWTDGEYSFSIVTGNALTNDTLQDIITKIK